MLASWIVAGVAGALAVAIWHDRRVLREAVARGCHELRGPLTAARLGLELGTRTGQLSPHRLRAIDLELGRATIALDDLSRPRSVRLWMPGVVDIEAVVRDSVEAWRAAAAVCGSTLSVSWSGGPARVLGDRFLIAQATGNLIANAIEHGGGEVSVSGRVERERVRIEVCDAGAGLPAPVAELVRRRDRARRRRGRGRGLAVALAVAGAHGGRLAAAPSERGARLVLELPLAAVAAEGRPA
jgi:signal transduction histidine kinase